MHNLFKNILIPVDFSINTEIAVKKGIELTEEDGVIHLLHVAPLHFPVFGRISFFNGHVPVSFDRYSSEARLAQWTHAITASFPGLAVKSHVVRGGNVQREIARLAKKVGAAFIIIGKHNYHKWFNFLNTVFPNQLARSTGSAVLTLKTGSLHNRIRSIVMPVSNTGKNVPAYKLDLVVQLARKYRARVYLVMLYYDAPEGTPNRYNGVINAFRMLRGSLNNPIEYKVVSGPTLSKASMEFAYKVNADLILLDAAGSLFPHVRVQETDRMRADSKLEVLSVMNSEYSH